MEFETYEDFLEEWGEPDALNFLVDVSKPDETLDITSWTFYIAQVRKNRISEVTIEKCTDDQYKQYAKKSLEIVRRGLEV